MEMLQSMKTAGFQVSQTTLFLADLGPGSFTGVRVGVVLAKTLGYAFGVPVGGADAFDLIDTDNVVALPSRKGEFFVRIPGKEPFQTEIAPEGAVGYGFEPRTPPDAKRFDALLFDIEPRSAIEFMPKYLIEPSISIPKRGFPEVSGA
jgi:hypothetical protein